MARAEIETPSGPAWADIEHPAGDPVGVLYAGHGAGGGVDAPDIRAVRAGALAAGFAVVRITQPYRVAGRRAPAPAPRLDEAWLAVTGVLNEQFSGLAAVHCGRSSGARVACRTATASGAVAIVALAFPVHPPGKPERSRLDELDAVTVPVLVVQGDRDAFGLPPEAPGRRIVVIPGDTHSLKKDSPAVTAAVTEFLTGLPARPRRRRRAKAG